jgi:branched-chain amino acid transport system substrate-binding protein
MIKKGFSAVSLLLVAAFALAACQPAAGPAFTPRSDALGTVVIPPGDPIHIGYWGVISGPDATLGVDAQRGVEIAIDDRGGKLLGRDIRMTSEDEGCGPEGGTTAATKLSVDTSIVALIGSSCSGAAAAGVPILNQAGMTTISPANTRPAFTDPAQRGPGGPLHTDFAGYLRTAHSDAVQGAVAAQFAYNELGIRRAATIHDGSPYAEALQGVFANTFRELGGTITSQEAIGPNDTDMRAVLTKIAADNVEMLYHPIFVAAGGHITAQAREISGLQDIALMGSDGIFSPDYVSAAGAAAEGVYLSSPDFSSFTSGYADFLAKHRTKYGTDPVSAFHAHAYDGANIVFKAIEAVAETAPDGTIYIGRQALRDAMFATRNHEGLIGNLSCDQYGDCSSPVIAIYQVSQRELGGQWPPEAPIWKP